MTGRTEPSTVGEYPTVGDVLTAGNGALVALGDPSVALRYLPDGRLLEQILPGWTLVSCVDRHPVRDKPRALFRWRAEDWWLLMQSTGVLRLLHTREWSDLPYFRLSAEPAARTLYMCGSSDDLIDEALYLRGRNNWSGDMLDWLLDGIPGDRADAERLLLRLR